MTTEDSTTQSNTTHTILLHYNRPQPTTPMVAEDFSPTMPGLAKAIVLLPVDGVLRACGLCEVVVKGE
jgi:hypothetical protein